MKGLRRLDVIHRLAFSMLLILPSTLGAQTRPPIIEKIAKTCGLDSWDKIEAIRYKFNAEGALKLSRTWVWEPKTGKVSYEGKDKDGKPVKVTYMRSELGSQPAVVKDEIDPAFINDQYNLLFTFHLVWDSSAKVEDTGMHKLPLGKGSAKRIVVTYPPEGGYNPGDTWELFVGADNRIQEFSYHRGRDATHITVMSWKDYRKAGPLLVALNRQGTLKGKPLQVSFSDVSVKLIGSNSWVNVQ